MRTVIKSSKSVVVNWKKLRSEGYCMKVLKSGSPGSAWSVEKVCTGKGNRKVGCNAVLLIEGGDVFGGTKTDYGGGKEEWKAFMCPECGAFTDISDVPSNVGTRGPSDEEKGIYG